MKENYVSAALPDIHDATKNILWDSLATALPPYDWSSNYDATKDLLIPRKNQDASGSCGGQATAYLHEIVEAKQSKTFEESSAKYIIAQTYIEENGVMLGSRMKDNLSVACVQGVARESLCPSYPPGGPVTDAFMNSPEDITDEARADAATRKGKSYAYGNPSNIDSVAQFVEVNGGAQMLIRGDNNGTWLSEEPKVSARGDWGHFMTLVRPAIRNNKKGIWALQSWDSAPQYQWFSENWFLSGFITQIGGLVMPTLPTPPVYTFTRDLKFGSNGIDVKILQQYLNRLGFTVAHNGPGSPGNETTYFGTLTKNAVKAFQTVKGINPASGYFGPKTRSLMNTL